MKHRLPILPAMVLGVVAAVAAGVFMARSRAGNVPAPVAGAATVSEASASSAPTRVATAGAAPLGRDNLTPGPRPDELMKQAGERLAMHDSLSAKIHLHSQLFGESLVASGVYLQGPRDSRRLRLELKVKLGEKVCGMLQVSDGTTLWIQDTNLDRPRLGRVDLHPALVALHQAGHRPGVDVLALGGIPLLIESLNRSFDFLSVRTERVGATPTYVVLGVCKPRLLGDLMPDQKEAIAAGAAPDLSRLPAHVPNQVEVYLGRESLFPNQIDYLRAATPGTHRDDDPLLARMKLVDVHFDAPIDAGQFVFQPGEAVPIDMTGQFVQRLLPR